MSHPSRRPFPIIGGAYTDTARPFDLQDCVNYLVEPAADPHQRSEGVLRGCPGLTTKVTLPTYPNRGMHDAEGNLFAVNGQTLYSVNVAAGTYAALGTIPGVQRCTIEHNQIAGGYEVVVSYGGSDGYVYNTASGSFSAITDPNFPGAKRLAFIDQYIIGVEPNGAYWFNSNLADAFTYQASNVYEASVAPDPLVSLVVNHDEVWAFGARTVQPFTDTGALDILFQSQNGVAMQIGCASPFSPQLIDNTMVWLANDGIVYAATGYMPVRVSTFAIEQAIAQCNKAGAFAFPWIDRGHKVYYLTFPDGHTWGYDLSSGLWHRRESIGFNNWRVSQIVTSSNQQIAGDIQNGNIYLVDWANYTEAGQPLIARRRSPYLHNNQNWVRMSALELLMQTCVAADGQDASVWIRYSDDYGTTWSNMVEVPLSFGIRATFNRLGRFRDRVFEIGVSSPVQRDIIGAVAELS